METSEQAAIALLQRAYDAFNRGDITGAVKELDPDIRWTEPDSFPGGGAYQGQGGVAAYLTQSRANWAEGRSEPEQFIVSGNRVIVFVHARVRPRGSTEWREVRLADVYTFHRGTPIEMKAFADRQEALQWAQATPP